MAPPSTPDKFPTPDMFDEVIQVMVGKAPAPNKMFTLHKGVASFYSAYFEAATKGNFKEGKSGIIELPTEDIQIFEKFVGWMYTRKLPPPTSSDAPADFSTPHKLWAFGDRRQIPLLMNAMIDALRDEVVRTWKVPNDQLKWLYENTTPESGLRRFDLFVLSRTGGTKLLEDEVMRASWPADALWDVLRAVWKLKEDGVTNPMRKEEFAQMDLCEYHSCKKA